MERIAEYCATLGNMDYLTMYILVDAFWRKETGGDELPPDAWLIVSAEIESRQPEPKEVDTSVCGIYLTHEESISIAKALGGNDKAEDLKDEICNAATAVVGIGLKEGTIKP